MENRIDIRQEIKKEISYMLGSIEECEMLAGMGVFEKLGWEYKEGSFFVPDEEMVESVMQVITL